MYKYIHSADDRVVYKYPAEPQVRNIVDGRGRMKNWSITMEVLITRADNTLRGNQWQHATSDYPHQYLDAHYTKEVAVSYFLRHHAPRGVEVSQAEYERLQAEYDAEARSR